MKRKKIIIMGAAGRDFHNFNLCFRDNPDYECVAFTAAQIPFIEKRAYPPALSGSLYPEGIPVYPEEHLARIIKEKKIDEAVFSYSDVSHDYVMHRASLVTALGADFVLLGAARTMLRSSRPVISVCAVRTGCGKSGVTRFAARELKKAGKKPVAIRHPMPYGELTLERVQRFASPDDMRRAGCTIEEMEEYEPLVTAGVTVWAGVDYEMILKEAEKEADIIIWDGGNNDMPFIKPDLEIVIADPLRPGHEIGYYPGEANLRRAACVVINKVNSARTDDIELVMTNINRLNPKAAVVQTNSIVTVGERMPLEGKKVLVIEDGPTLTHGGMDYGAGIIAARLLKAEPVDPAVYAVGTIKETLQRYPHLKNILPAVGYSKQQISELEETINRTPCDAVLVATPVDLSRLIRINRPAVRVSYEVEDIGKDGLAGIISEFIKRTK
ncbi:MAG: GTPase [Deltaproteobacteria bacterium]|nr:GTPase [Deltaproteobacteria bacterium]